MNIYNIFAFTDNRATHYTDLGAINCGTIDTIDWYVNLRMSTNIRIASYTVIEYKNKIRRAKNRLFGETLDIIIQCL